MVETLNWQERFPLPQSLDDQEFHRYSRSLPDGDREKLIDELSVWAAQQRLNIFDPRESHRTICHKLDTFLEDLYVLIPGKPVIAAPARGGLSIIGMKLRERGSILEVIQRYTVK